MSYMTEALGRFQAIQTNGSIPGIREGAQDTQLQEAGQEFESLFVKMMMDSMRSTRNQEDNFTYGGMAENIFEDMLYTEYSRTIARRADFGIADMIVNQFSSRAGKMDSQN